MSELQMLPAWLDADAAALSGAVSPALTLAAALPDAEVWATDVSADALAGLLTRIQDNTISGKIAKEVFEAMWAEGKGADEIIGVLYLDSRERGALRSASAQAALETLSAEAALAIENDLADVVVLWRAIDEITETAPMLVRRPWVELEINAMHGTASADSRQSRLRAGERLR